MADLGDPAGLVALSERFFEALLVDHYSPRTVGAPQDVTRELLERFKAWQHAYRDEEGHGLAVLSQGERAGGERRGPVTRPGRADGEAEQEALKWGSRCGCSRRM